MLLFLIEENMIKSVGHVHMISMNLIVKTNFLFKFFELSLFFIVRVSVDILKVYLNMNLERGSYEIEWTTLRYLIGEGKFKFHHF